MVMKETAGRRRRFQGLGWVGLGWGGGPVFVPQGQIRGGVERLAAPWLAGSGICCTDPRHTGKKIEFLSKMLHHTIKLSYLLLFWGAAVGQGVERVRSGSNP